MHLVHVNLDLVNSSVSDEILKYIPNCTCSIHEQSNYPIPKFFEKNFPKFRISRNNYPRTRKLNIKLLESEQIIFDSGIFIPFFPINRSTCTCSVRELNYYSSPKIFSKNFPRSIYSRNNYPSP